MTTWKLYSTNDGKIAVVTPYNAHLVAECKRRMAKWIDLTISKKDGTKAVIKAWKLDASHRAAIEALCADLFPPRESLIERVVRWEKTGASANGPTMDGYDLVGFGRDRYWIKRFDGGESIEIVEIVEDNLESGGSRNNPRLFGSVTLRLRCRPQAVAAGDGWTVEVID